MKIFNSLTKQKELFVPLEEGYVRLYVCGMTVYDYSHIGHARSLVVFDLIVRYLLLRGYNVTHVRNITDVDDKIIQRASDNQESVMVLTDRFIQALHEDEQALGIIPPTHEPRAMEYVPAIIALIQQLMDQDIAYVIEDFGIYFDVSRFSEYGALSHRNVDALKAGVRIKINENKRNPLDFVLWKSAKPDEPSWSSPWGEGRPGWHIECSAMSSALLGQPFDIHGGGLDLKFPHHENEIAQSEAAAHKPFVKYWMHSGLLNIEKEKMSKSLGNIVTIRDALQAYDVEVLRYFLLSAHYRSMVTYSEENLAHAEQSLSRLYFAIRDVPSFDESRTFEQTAFTDRFFEAMDDDFNTPEALSVLFDVTHRINQLKLSGDMDAASLLVAELKSLAKVFGFLQKTADAFLQKEAQTVGLGQVEHLIAARQEAREKKDWKQADHLRDELKAMGIVIEDSVNGTTWRRERY